MVHGIAAVWLPVLLFHSLPYGGYSPHGVEGSTQVGSEMGRVGHKPNLVPFEKPSEHLAQEEVT